MLCCYYMHTMKRAFRKFSLPLHQKDKKNKKHEKNSRSSSDGKESSSSSNSSDSINENSSIKSSEEIDNEHTNGVDESFDGPISPEDQGDKVIPEHKKNEAPAETTWPQKNKTSAEKSWSQENETYWPQESEINAKDVPLSSEIDRLMEEKVKKPQPQLNKEYMESPESKITPFNEIPTYDFRLREVKRPTSIGQSQSSELTHPEISIEKLDMIGLAIYWFGWYSEDLFIRTADKIKIIDRITGFPASGWFLWLFSLKSWLNIHD
ncbi:hypothetical protein Glove_22g159 [Diversispora epigaea]|uniref:Uncharacterized protein n=1 Tax=Diversispora epigaea TaxID=1348612 RepID=A0A397JVI6_9GLOM|nr:hypothetical protein Glove_22g159 [Diversispora epigaea]